MFEAGEEAVGVRDVFEDRGDSIELMLTAFELKQRSFGQRVMRIGIEIPASSFCENYRKRMPGMDHCANWPTPGR